MINMRSARVDEVILAFLQAEIDSPTMRGSIVTAGLAHIRADRGQLVDRADLSNPQQNYVRQWLLGYARGYGLNQYLFTSFPSDTAWRLFTVIPPELESFKYANDQGWTEPSGPTRLVAAGVKNVEQIQAGEKVENVAGIATRLRGGDRFPPLIAVQCAGAADVVLMEGHTRATAYVLTGLPDVIEVFIGTSERMWDWVFI
jgi:hypothetical protein